MKPAEIFLDAQSKTGLLQMLADRVVFGLAPILPVPRRICARLKVQQHCQLVGLLPRQRLRMAEHMKGVDRNDGQDS